MDGMAAKIGNITAYVNGDITGRSDLPRRSFYRSMLDDLLARIEQRLLVLGITATEASRNGGLSSDAIRNIRRAVAEKRDQGVSTKTIAGLVKGLHTTEAWLLGGQGREDAPSTPLVRLIGRVGEVAGGVVTPLENSWAPAIAGADQDTVAVEIAAAMREFEDEGTLLYFGYRTPEPDDDHLDALCLIETENTALVARLLRGSAAGVYDVAPLVGPKARDVKISGALEFIGFLSARQAARISERQRDTAA